MMRSLVIAAMMLMLPLAASADPLDKKASRLLQEHGWAVAGEANEVEILIPKDLSGLPFFHYQMASNKIGLNLSVAAGREVDIRRYTLTERSPKSGYRLFAHVAFLDGRIIGAWLATEAPIAPGLAALDQNDFGKDL